MMIQSSGASPNMTYLRELLAVGYWCSSTQHLCNYSHKDPISQLMRSIGYKGFTHDSNPNCSLSSLVYCCGTWAVFNPVNGAPFFWSSDNGNLYNRQIDPSE